MTAWNRLQKNSQGLIGRLRQEQGVVLVEFAIVLPILIMIILGILYFGRYEDYTNQMTQLAEEAARYASVDNNPQPTNLDSYIASQAAPELQNGSSDVTKALKVYVYYPTSSTGAVGGTVRACVTATVLFPLSLGSGTITETATMRLEQAQTIAQWTPDSTASVPSSCPTS
jgi:Flp pilus assembly protein TadG